MPRALVLLLALVASACDIRPLTSAELYGAGDAAPDRLSPTPDAGSDAPALETPAAETGPETPPLPCPQGCAADQFCDELANRCAPRVGVGMLSGQVIDDCNGASLDALVGIAGRHVCSFKDKGSYFFNGIPLGTLKLTSSKEGYELFGLTIEIASGGMVRDIRLARVGGCASPMPAQVACTCTAPTCQE